MLVAFLVIFVVDRKIICGYNFVAPLTIKEVVVHVTLMKGSVMQKLDGMNTIIQLKVSSELSKHL